MGKLFNIYPHHGYLNTDITIVSLTGKKDMIVDCAHETTGLKALYSLTDGQLSLRLPAGKHIFSYCTEGGVQSEEVTIEDAIKLGGGSINGGCLSNKSPWGVIRMTDRIYFHNSETGEEFYEMSVSPEEIRFLNKDNILFYSKNNGYSIYSFDKRTIIREFREQPLFEDTEKLIFKESDKGLIVFDIKNSAFQETAIIASFFAINKETGKLYYSEDRDIISFDIHSVSEVSRNRLSYELISILPSGHYVCRQCYSNGKTSIHIFSIEDGNKLCSLSTKHQVVSCNGVEFENVAELISKRAEFCKALAPSQRWAISICYSIIKDIVVVKGTAYYSVSNHTRVEYNEEKNIELHNSKTDLIIPLGYGHSMTSMGNKFVLCESGRITLLDEGIKVQEYEGTLNGSYIEGKGSHSLLDLEGNVIAQGQLLFGLKARDRASYRTYNVNLVSLGYYGIKDSEIIRLCRLGKDTPLISFKDTSAYIHKGILIVNPLDSAETSAAVCHNTITEIASTDIPHVVITSEDMSQYILNMEESLYRKIPGCKNNEPVRILSKLFDPSKYKEALFTSDGNDIVFSDGTNKFYHQNIKTGVKTAFDPGNFIRHINGYKPVIDISHDKPRIIDPVSGQMIASKADYAFYSPDGRYNIDSSNSNAGDGVGFIEYFHKHINSTMSRGEFQEIARLNTPSFFSADEHLQKERLQYMKEHPTWFIEDIRKEYNIFRDKNRVLQLTPEHIVMYANKDDDTRIPYAERDAIAYYVKFKKEFSDAVVRVNEYLKLHISGEISTRKIDLGIPLWFLNYVSFSFDGKMMSVAGRYPDNTQDEDSGSISGLFLLYDIEKDKITFRKTNTNAVWVSAFNKDNLVACYDSCPGSYIMDAETPDSKIIRMENDSHAGQNRILGRSFLCFSPSGKLMAMSKQGYVRYENATEERPWGHQPSTCVYIRSSKDLNNDIAQFNDHGSGISGVATRARTVSMVAFSPDDSKMLSVSNDGVVVVRNLHIEL